MHIDCPFRKLGFDPKTMKPFESVEKYMEFLDREDRAAWQKPDTIISAMKLKGNETIADVGAGSGYFTFRFASVLPKGKVIAIEIQPEMIKHIQDKATTLKVKNLDAVLATEDDPKVPDKANIVFLCDVLHHVKTPSKWLSTLYTEVNKGTKLILIDFKEGPLPQGPPEKMKIPEKQIISLVSGAGFTFINENKTLLPFQNYYQFEKK